MQFCRKPNVDSVTIQVVDLMRLLLRMAKRQLTNAHLVAKKGLMHWQRC